ncbi:hypothetical protein RFI_31318 [Reticulomyxa filosa]|uniref:Uncharacterized protein n=1 Tax=Reticulomyxa filosa TaxID=46433 RepID=X6LY46_RETFI|nr:hypothetical protein RFI_31318 [Reticulomyxa filosa]|eukprot:ETO06077.1 hypothetical protein RFI_31318 [Reticulomyxa filosa]
MHLLINCVCVFFLNGLFGNMFVHMILEICLYQVQFHEYVMEQTQVEMMKELKPQGGDKNFLQVEIAPTLQRDGRNRLKSMGVKTFLLRNDLPKSEIVFGSPQWTLSVKAQKICEKYILDNAEFQVLFFHTLLFFACGGAFVSNSLSFIWTFFLLFFLKKKDIYHSDHFQNMSSKQLRHLFDDIINELISLMDDSYSVLSISFVFYFVSFFFLRKSKSCVSFVKNFYVLKMLFFLLAVLWCIVHKQRLNMLLLYKHFASQRTKSKKITPYLLVHYPTEQFQFSWKFM